MALNPTTVPVDTRGQLTVNSPKVQSAITGSQYVVAFLGGMAVNHYGITLDNVQQVVNSLPAIIGGIAAIAVAAKGVWNTIRGIYKQIKIAQLPASAVVVSGTGDGRVTAAEVPVTTTVVPATK